MSLELRKGLTLGVLIRRPKGPQLDNGISRAGDNAIVIDHSTHVYNFVVTVNRLEQVDLDVARVCVVVHRMSDVHHVDLIVSNGDKAVRLSSVVSLRVETTPADIVYIIWRIKLKSLPAEASVASVSCGARLSPVSSLEGVEAILIQLMSSARVLDALSRFESSLAVDQAPQRDFISMRLLITRVRLTV